MSVVRLESTPQSAGAARFVRRHVQFYFTMSFNEATGVQWETPIDDNSYMGEASSLSPVTADFY
jgi:hypothetical protein